MIELRRNIENPKPITWRSCSLSLVMREPDAGERGVEEMRVAAAEAAVDHVAHALPEQQHAARGHEQRRQRAGDPQPVGREEPAEPEQMDELAFRRGDERGTQGHALMLTQPRTVARRDAY
jgi:hypothetical protein